MLYKKRKYLAAAVILCLIYLCAKTYRIQQYIPQPKLQPLTARQINDLPQQLAQVILSGKIPSETILLSVQYGQPQLFNLGVSIDSVRLKIFKNFLSRIHISMPDGHYLINFHDGYGADLGYPLLVFASHKTSVANGWAILIPDCDAMQSYNDLFSKIDHGNQTFPWTSKINKIFWRGVSTGMRYTQNGQEVFDRLLFLQAAKNKPYIDAGFTEYVYIKNPTPEFTQEYPLLNRVSPYESVAYKYLFSIDGNSCAYSRVAWILYSNSVLFKHDSDAVQWYYDKLQPWVHYIPVSKDFSDLEERYLWAQTHQQEVQDIAANGRKLAQEIFTDQALERAFVDALVSSRQNIK